MTTSIDSSRPRPAGPTPRSCQLAVSSYDRVASLLIALLGLTGVTVLGLLIIFFSSRIFARHRAVPVTLAALAGRSESAAVGFGRDLELPGLEELPSLAQPQLQQTLSALAQAVADKVALLDERAHAGELLSGAGRGAGDNRQPGSGSDGPVERVSRAERWEIQFQVDRLETYAEQLDSFGVELATFGADDKVHYAYNLSKATPDRRVGSPAAERRLYMTWRSGSVIQADRELLTRAGITTRGQIILQFYPAATEAELADKERQYAGRRDVNEIRKTVFALRTEGTRFAFYVVDQKYF